jgi:hypothetical protein
MLSRLASSNSSMDRRSIDSSSLVSLLAYSFFILFIHSFILHSFNLLSVSSDFVPLARIVGGYYFCEVKLASTTRELVAALSGEGEGSKEQGDSTASIQYNVYKRRRGEIGADQQQTL